MQYRAGHGEQYRWRLVYVALWFCLLPLWRLAYLYGVTLPGSRGNTYAMTPHKAARGIVAGWDVKRLTKAVGRLTTGAGVTPSRRLIRRGTANDHHTADKRRRWRGHRGRQFQTAADPLHELEPLGRMHKALGT